MISNVVQAPWGGGLTTTVLPAASAAPAGPPDRAAGKLNGVTTAHVPYGRMTS